MIRRPIGVWFSLALAILLLNFWFGSMLASRVAGYWYSHHQLEQGILTDPDRTHIVSELAELSAAQTLRFSDFVTQNQPQLRNKILRNEIDGLTEMQRRSKVAEIRPDIDLDLGLAYLDAAMTEEQDNNSNLANKNMQCAQVLFKSLGWQDYSQETLKSVARRKLDKLSFSQVNGNGK